VPEDIYRDFPKQPYEPASERFNSVTQFVLAIPLDGVSATPALQLPAGPKTIKTIQPTSTLDPAIYCLAPTAHKTQCKKQKCSCNIESHIAYRQKLESSNNNNNNNSDFEMDDGQGSSSNSESEYLDGGYESEDFS